MNKKVLVIILIAVASLAAGVSGYVYWNEWKKSKIGDEALETAEKAIDSATKGLLSPVGANPLENKPDINPADKANPFKNIKTNPFE